MAPAAVPPVPEFSGKRRPAKAAPPLAAAWLAMAVQLLPKGLSRPAGSVFAGVGQVGAVFVVYFAAGDRRVEGTDQAHVFGATVQGMLVVLVECIQSAVGDLVGFAGG